MGSDTDGSYQVHEFLLDQHGDLRTSSEQLGRVREYIDDLPETSATFRLNQIDDVFPPNFEDAHLELLGAWPVHDIYASEAERLFVNPNYVHAHTYSDLVVKCKCGAVLTRNYADDNGSLRDEHNHAADCLPHYRLRARAEMAEKRYEMLFRLGSLGWKGAAMAPRFGVQPSSMGAFAQRFHTDLRTVFDAYRRVASNTYRYLVRQRGVSAQTVADCYGHAPTTLGRWANEYGTYEDADVTFTRNEDGEYTWTHADRVTPIEPSTE